MCNPLYAKDDKIRDRRKKMITNKIKKYRKTKNITQEELANELEVTRKTLNLIENNKILPKVDVAYKICLILDITIEKLFYNEEYKVLCLKKQEESFIKIADAYFNQWKSK